MARFGKMESIAWRAARQTGRQGGRPTLEIAARAADRIGVDDDARITEGHVLVTHGCHDGLIVDARVGHGDAELDKGRNSAALELQHRRRLTEEYGFGEISPTWIC